YFCFGVIVIHFSYFIICFFQADDGIRSRNVTGVQTCALPISSTPLNDKYETEAIKHIFGKHAYDLAISSTKAQTGHLLGAAGGVEAVLSVKSLDENIMPATMNYETKDPDCDLDYIPNEARERDLNVVMSNCFGCGGHNVALIFKKYKG